MLALLVAAQISAAPPPSPVGHLAWLTGCWTLSQPSGVVEEQWMAPGGGVMLGMARTLRGGALRDYEFMRIVEAAGSIAFVARPSGQPEATFPLLTLSEVEAVFENPAHDFPQRVIYRRTGPDTIMARIEGQTGGQAKAVDFAYKRCPTGN